MKHLKSINELQDNELQEVGLFYEILFSDFIAATGLYGEHILEITPTLFQRIKDIFISEARLSNQTTKFNISHLSDVDPDFHQNETWPRIRIVPKPIDSVKGFYIFCLEDDYFLIKKFSYTSIDYYKCDGFDGLSLAINALF